MAFCKHCGNQLPDDAAFCSNCGTSVDNAQQTGQQNDQQNAQQADQQPVQQNTQQAPQQPVQPEVMNSDGTVLPSDKGLAWLAYIPWAPVFLVPLFVRKTSEYCKFHVKQGATLWAVGVAYEIVKSILLAIINAIFRDVTAFMFITTAWFTTFSTSFSGQALYSFSFSLLSALFTPLPARKRSCRSSAKFRGSECCLIKSTLQSINNSAKELRRA